VAVPTSYLTPADSRTRAIHIYKFGNISAAYKNSFFPRTVPEWNNLDKDIAEAPSLSCFKSRLPWVPELNASALGYTGADVTDHRRIGMNK